MKLQHKITGAIIEVNGAARGDKWVRIDTPEAPKKAPAKKKTTRKKVQKDVNDVHDDRRCDQPVEGADS